MLKKVLILSAVLGMSMAFAPIVSAAAVKQPTLQATLIDDTTNDSIDSNSYDNSLSSDDSAATNDDANSSDDALSSDATE